MAKRRFDLDLILAYLPEILNRGSSECAVHECENSHSSAPFDMSVELSALTIQCLADQRIPSIDSLNDELFAWHITRNSIQKGVDWHFTTSDSRLRLKRLHPCVNI